MPLRAYYPGVLHIMTTDTVPADALPGPRSIFPVQNVRPFIRNRALFLWDMAQRYGDVSKYKVGIHHVYFINKPELIQDVLVTNAASYSKTFATRMGKMILGEGLLTNEGESHRRQRRMLQPAFSRKRIDAYSVGISQAADVTSQAWTDGAQVDMLQEMMRLTLRIAGKTFFGAETDKDAKTTEEALDAFFGLIDRLANPAGALLNMLPLPSNARFRNARRDIDALIFRFIAERRESGEERDDVLSLMLRLQDEDDGKAMSDQQIRDEAITLFLAGHETTALVMTWAWMLLAQNPEEAEALRHEATSVLNGRAATAADLAQLPYARMVASESMRLYPPAYLIDREALEDTPLGNFIVPKGHIVFTSPYVTQRTERYFHDPLRFDPMRWTPEEVAKRPRFSFFPFGGGPRTCIGESFAWMETTILLSTLAQHWSPTLPQGYTPELDPKVTLRPKGGMPMTLHRIS